MLWTKICGDVFSKVIAILSKYYFIQCDSLFNQIIVLGFKTRPKFGKPQRTSFVWNTLVSPQCTATFSCCLLFVSLDIVSNIRSVTAAVFAACPWEDASWSRDCRLIPFKRVTSWDLKPLHHLYSPDTAALWFFFSFMLHWETIWFFLSQVDIREGIIPSPTRGHQYCTSLVLFGKHNIYHFCMRVKEKTRKRDSKFIWQNAASFMIQTLAMTVFVIFNTRVEGKHTQKW